MFYGKAKVEYEPRKIRNARVQCPQCNNWFYPADISTSSLNDYTSLVLSGYFLCPRCNINFTIQKEDIEETSEMPNAMVLKSIWKMEE